MPKAYSLDFRKKILESCLNNEGSISEIAKRFKVGESTVKRIKRRYKETGDVVLYLHRAGRHELINAKGKAYLQACLEKQPDLTLMELQSKYHHRFKLKPVLTVFHNVLKGLNIRYKKKSVFAEQQLTPDVKKKN